MTNGNTAADTNMEAMQTKAQRFHTLGAGCFLYALFYTFCLYHNTSGITYPFFAGGTLYFFGCFIKKFGSRSADAGSQPQTIYIEYINRKFLAAAILIAGALNCATDSGVLIFFNKMLMFVLLAVLLMQCWHDITGWSMMAYVKAGIQMLSGGICKMLVPAEDFHAARCIRRIQGQEGQQAENRKRIIRSIVIGIVISIPIALFITILLGSADAVFCQLLENVLLTTLFDMDIFENTRLLIGIVFEIVLVFTLLYGILVYNKEPQNIQAVDNAAAGTKTNWDSYIAVTVNAVLCVIYVIFSVIQIFGLFFQWMELPAGWTYASYARHGFFELVFVCLFNIILVLCTLAYFAHSWLLKVLLAVICGCTYIMTASSAYRMVLYIASYQLTFLRLFVLWALLMIAFVMAGVLVYIFRARFGLFRYILMVVTIGWLVFSAAKPDYWIATYNIAAGKWGDSVDTHYLGNGLSLDALPALDIDTYEEFKNNYYRYYNRGMIYKAELKDFMGFRKFNLSRAYAGYLIDHLQRMEETQ